MPPFQAEQLKEQGNTHFKKGDFDQANTLYSQAIQQNANNPLLYTNRANARLKLKQWELVIDDCLRSIELLQQNMKAFYFLGQAQLELNHPNEALSSALTAYDLCSKHPQQTSSAFAIASFVLRCKRAKWDVRERERIRRRHELLGELEAKLEGDRVVELEMIERRRSSGEMGEVTAEEESAGLNETCRRKVEELRNSFAISDPEHVQRRVSRVFVAYKSLKGSVADSDSQEIPSYLIDDISFEIMHDPVVTKHGHSYERATIVEHLKRNPVDPLTRETLLISDLRSNLALKKACDEFWENNAGWAIEW